METLDITIRHWMLAEGRDGWGPPLTPLGYIHYSY